MSLQQNLPPPSAPFVDADGRLTYDAISLLRILWSRTGFAPGVGSDDLALLSVLNGIDTPQDPQARAEAASAFLAGIQPQTLAIDPTARASGADGVFTALAPKPVQSELGEAEAFALMLVGPVYASISSAFLSGVTSFNGRTGAVTLTSGDVTTALGFTPGTGTVTSVATDATLSGGPITTTGTLSVVSAPKLTTARTFTYTGDAAGGPTSFDGAASVSTALTLANTAVTPGTYGDGTHVAQVTVDAKGRVTAASNVAVSGGGGPSVGYWSPLTNGDPINPDLIFDGSGDTIAVWSAA